MGAPLEVCVQGEACRKEERMHVVGVSRGRRASDSGRKENEETWQLKKTWGSGTVTQTEVGCELVCGNRGEKTENEALKHGQDVAVCTRLEDCMS